MRIAIYGRKFNDSAIQHVQQLIDSFLAHEVEITIYAAFHAYLIPRIQLPDSVKLFTQHQDLVNQVDCLVSIGGDGTMLDTLTLVRDSGIPVIGINMGRLGFLASIERVRVPGPAPISRIILFSISPQFFTILSVKFWSKIKFCPRDFLAFN